MKPNIRMLVMKLHAYLACFFLPITLLYIATGVLYLFDIKGEVAKTVEYPLPLTQGWPESQQAAQVLVEPVLSGKKHAALPEDYYPDEGIHDWYGYKQEVILKPSDDPAVATMIVHEHDLWMQFLLIHKGLAGTLFWLFGIVLGANMLFSLISGVMLAVQIPRFKNNSLLALVMGVVVLAVVFFQGS